MKVFKKIIKFMAIFLVIIIVIFTIFGFFMMRGQKEVLNTKIGHINLENINDGEYVGTFNGYRWSNTVVVTIKDKKITNISFKKGQVFRLAEMENELINRVITNQSVNVDTVAGSTVSSKAILKAIENALNE